MRKTGKLVIFSIGACGYGLIEILWRGHTHWSMLIAGGLSFSGLSAIAQKMKHATLFVKAVAGGFLITALEYIFGIIFNVFLNKKVWDYSNMPFNLHGQICALYSFFWIILSLLFIPLAGVLSSHLQRERK